ncbi:MAG: hypothetical protein KDF54_12870 [Hydrogenophaga sp.]|nr:hypothetical protein [Hydrogenophaga sp.]
MTRPDLAAIRAQYQVPDDEMTVYHPRAYGAVDIPFSEGREMTRTEGQLLDRLTQNRGLVGLSEFRDIAREALGEAVRRYPDHPVPAGIPADRAGEWQGNDGHRDAFRHAYWNARMTQVFGPDWTRAFTTAHEGVPGNPANREAMDLYNNSVGIGIGAANPDASPKETADLIQRAVTDGRAVVMDRNGDLEWSDRVPFGQHGLTPDGSIAPHLDKPGVTSPQRVGQLVPRLTPEAQDLLIDSQRQVRMLAERHGLPWDQGLDNTVAALAHQARAEGLTGISHLAVRDGQIRFAQRDGATLKEGSLDARLAANTPEAVSHERLAETDHAMAQVTARAVERPSTEPLQRVA